MESNGRAGNSDRPNLKIYYDRFGKSSGEEKSLLLIRTGSESKRLFSMLDKRLKAEDLDMRAVGLSRQKFLLLIQINPNK